MELSLNRLVNLIKRDIGIYWQTYIKMFLAFIAIQTLVNWMSFGNNWMIMVMFYAFIEYNDTAQSKIGIFTLAASNLEKFLNGLFITFIFFPILILASMHIGILIRYIFDIALFGQGSSQVLENIPMIWGKMNQQLIAFIPIISIMFFGNIYFKKRGSMTILLSLVAYAFIITMINAYVIYLLKGESHYFITNNFILLPEYTKYIVSSIISIFFLLLSYLRITEKEV